jgi:hypothetical protein
MISFQKMREKVRGNPRACSATGLLPLTIVMIWTVIRGFTDKTEPHDGLILRVLGIVAFVGVALIWLGMLRLPKRPVDS